MSEIFQPQPAQYSSASGPPLVLAAEPLQQLQRLADGASMPGAAVTVSDLVAGIIGDFLDSNKAKLAKLHKADEQAELERVAVVHGGEAA